MSVVMGNNNCTETNPQDFCYSDCMLGAMRVSVTCGLGDRYSNDVGITTVSDVYKSTADSIKY